MFYDIKRGVINWETSATLTTLVVLARIMLFVSCQTTGTACRRVAEALTSHPLKLSKNQMRVVAEGFGWWLNHIARLVIVRKAPQMF